MEEKQCMLKGCSGELHHYDGALGYEALVCNQCGAHYTEDGIYPQWNRQKQSG